MDLIDLRGSGTLPPAPTACARFAPPARRDPSKLPLSRPRTRPRPDSAGGSAGGVRSFREGGCELDVAAARPAIARLQRCGRRKARCDAHGIRLSGADRVSTTSFIERRHCARRVIREKPMVSCLPRRAAREYSPIGQPRRARDAASNLIGPASAERRNEPFVSKHA
jgi:hypothetical protein